MSTISRKDYEPLWTAVLKTTTAVLEQASAIDGQGADLTGAVAYIECVATLVREFTDDKSREAPAACVATLALLHGVLFDVCRAGMCD